MLSPAILSAAAADLIAKCSALSAAGVTVRYVPNRRGQAGAPMPDAVLSWVFPTNTAISSSQNGRQIVRQLIAGWGQCLDNHEGEASAQAVINGAYNAIHDQRVTGLGCVHYVSSSLTEPNERSPQHWQFEIIFQVDVQVKPA